jgi:hypothetical protein
MTSPAVAAPRALLTDFQPATFLERGATVPFTSPLLQQARIRLGLGGTREIVLRNPSGGPGWYVGPWDGVAEMARATVHDRLVYKRIEETGAISPLDIRRAGLEAGPRLLLECETITPEDFLPLRQDLEPGAAARLPQILCVASLREPRKRTDLALAAIERCMRRDSSTRAPLGSGLVPGARRWRWQRV